MILLENISEDEMVAIFLKAEIDSPRFCEGVQNRLTAAGKNRTIIDRPNIADPDENEIRADLLEYRGYKSKQILFEGFPTNVSWERVILDKSDVERCKHMNNDDWRRDANGSDFIKDVALKIQSGGQTSISQYALHAVQSWDPSEVPEPIIVARNSGDAPVILEGHIRLIAFLLLPNPTSITAILGYSEAITGWVFY